MRAALFTLPSSAYARVTAAAAGFSIVLGLVVLLGWTAGAYSLTTVLPGVEPMRPNTALCFIASGLSLWLARSSDSAAWRGVVSGTLGVLVTALGLLTLLEYLLGFTLPGIDDLLSWSGISILSATSSPRMAANTAAGFTLAGAALVLAGSSGRRNNLISQVLAISAGIIGALALVGYAYGVYQLTQLTALNHGVQMALHTAVAFTVLAVGILAARPDQGIMERITENSVGGVLLRSLLPVMVGLPLLLGWITVLLERSLANSGITDISMMAIVSAVALFVVVWNTSSSLDRLDAERRLAEEALRKDMAERIRAQQELQQERNFVSAVLDTAGALVVVLDRQGRIVRFNRACETTTGYTASEVADQPFWNVFLVSDELEEVKNVFLQLRAGNFPMQHENYWLAKDGSRRLIAWSNTALLDGTGSVEFVISTGVDVTKQRAAEAEKERLGKDLHLLLESTDEGLYGVDVQGDCTFINASGSSMVGYTREEALGKNMHDLIHHTCGDGRPYLIDDCPIYEAFHERRGVRVDDEVFWRKDGTSFPVEYSSYPIIEGDVIKGAVVAFSDITERKASDYAIRKLNDDLARRAAELAAANRELESFSYSVSHDLRAPLRSIDGFSQALLEDYGEGLDAVGKDYLRRVRAASQRMGTLIDDMLALSRLTRGEMIRTEVDLSEIAGKIASGLKASDPGRHVEFVIQQGLTASGDARLLEAVLQNLLGNAWKFTSQAPSSRIEFGETAVGEETAYFVRDNGAGFDMAYVGKLFGAFQRLHAATEFPGNGIGLATVQRIVHRHGGRVWAEGEVGKGATFYFTLG